MWKVPKQMWLNQAHGEPVGFCIDKLGFIGGSAYLITVENYIFFYRNDSHKTAETMRLLTKSDEGLIYQYGY